MWRNFFIFNSSFKELLDDPYADLKSFAVSALSEEDDNHGEKVMKCSCAPIPNFDSNGLPNQTWLFTGFHSMC